MDVSKVLFLLVISLISITFVFCVDPLVLTENGLLRGLRAESGNYAMFLGIPYAKVDENNPFGESLDPDPIEGTYDAYDDSVKCAQINGNIFGDLDCLILNVYVPYSATSENKLPVMVYIHGGTFKTGSLSRTIYGPKFLVRHDVILVTLNYRVGIYGFLNTATSDIPGNSGLKDQVKALKWVKTNIAAFGGNPNNVTLFGESAGGSSVEFHLLSNLSNGLFHAVIRQSGAALCETAMADPDYEAPLKLVRNLGFENVANNSEAVKILSEQHPHEVLSAVTNIGYDFKFKPSVETAFNNVESMLLDKPSNLLKNGQINTVPMIIGFNSKEKLLDLNNFFLDSDYFENNGITFRQKLEYYFNLSTEEYDYAVDLVKHFYVGGDKEMNNVTAYKMTEFNSDYIYIHPIERSTRYNLAINSNPVYRYIFDYNGIRNYAKYLSNVTDWKGAAHGDDLSFLFEQEGTVYPDDETDQLVIDRMTRMWTNFAKYGNPTPVLDDVITTKWEPATDMDSKVLMIDAGLHMEFHPFHRRMAFWDAFHTMFGDKTRW